MNNYNQNKYNLFYIDKYKYSLQNERRSYSISNCIFYFYITTNNNTYKGN